MRILWLTPSLRTRARIGADALREMGAEVMLVTSDLNYEHENAREYETVLLGRPVPTADWIPILRAYQKARRFHPDVVVTEYLRDPRWRMMTSLAPRVRLIHDAEPHDETHIPPWWNRMFFDRWDSKADATIVFSNYVAERLRVLAPKQRVYAIPLHSDLAASLVPPLVPPHARKDFVMFGRQRPYKNHEVVFSAWEEHLRSDAWRGDELVLLGGGDITCPLPRHTRWEKGEYQYRKIVNRLAHAKGSIVHYRNGASQSGVQLLSLQLGVPTLISDAGGLPEYQPNGMSITGPDDVSGLSRAISALANPEEVTRQCEVALQYYRKKLAPEISAAKFLEALGDVVSNRTSSRIPESDY